MSDAGSFLIKTGIELTGAMETYLILIKRYNELTPLLLKFMAGALMQAHRTSNTRSLNT